MLLGLIRNAPGLVTLLFVWWLLLPVQGLQAQVATGLTPSGKHARYWKFAEQRKRSLSKEERKALKDSLRTLKSEDRLAGLELREAARRIHKRKKMEMRLERLQEQGAGTARVERLLRQADRQGIRPDPQLARCIEQAREQLPDLQLPMGLQQDLDSLQALIATDTLPQVDSLHSKLGRQVLTKAEQMGMEQLNQQMGMEHIQTREADAQAIQAAMPKPAAIPVDPQALEQSIPRLSKEEALAQASHHLAGFEKERQAAREQVAQLRKRYSKVLNSDEVDAAVRKYSLKEEPLKRRLVWGGAVQVLSTEPVVIDASPNLAYRWNKLLRTGIGLHYRRNFGQEELSNAADALWGYKAFVAHDVWAGFFGLAEIEQLYSRVPAATADAQASWQPTLTLPVGLGRRFRIHRKVLGTMMLTYNLLYDPNDEVYPSAVNFKFGFELDRR